MHNIIIVDDHPVVVMALRILLEKNGFNVTATSDNGVDALKKIKIEAPDAIIIDIGIPQLDGLEVIRRLRKQNSSIRILVLTAQPALIFSTRCLREGASGFISKKDNLDEIVRGLHAVLAGYTYFPEESRQPDEATPVPSEVEFLRSLSSREIIVLQQLSSGLSNRQIADRMLLSEKTISTYKKSIMKTARVNSLIEIVDIARRNGII
ncbi:UNVERIFIED_CONTAM: response regulator transcription factor [Aeromonas hydrophila]